MDLSSCKFRKRKRTVYVIVHCSATPSDRAVTADEIHAWHQAKGWKAIGYHYVVTRDGTLEMGRPLEVIGAHTRGRNRVSVGICLVGGVTSEGKPEANFTWQQYETLRRVLQNVTGVYPQAMVCGHRDFVTSKACPSFDVEGFWYG